MKNKTFNIIIKCLSILLTSISTGFAANYDSEVFEFQQKLANGGNAHAQYRLATMYESGRGIKKDNSLAMTWYKKSSLNNHPAATRYLTYIDIKKSGFKPQHKSWLKTVYSDAKKGDESALIILGKIHENGTGVKKSLKKSQRYFKLAFNRGNTEAEANLNRVEQKIFSQNNKLKTKTESLAHNKEPETKQTEKNNLKKQANKKNIVKLKPQKHNTKKQLSNNNKELKRLEAERNKIARERKELETLRKSIAKNQTVKANAIKDKPIQQKKIVNNDTYKATSYTTDVCNEKTARFMSLCQ